MRPGYIIIDEVAGIPDHVWDVARRKKGATMSEDEARTDGEPPANPAGTPISPVTPEPGLQTDDEPVGDEEPKTDEEPAETDDQPEE